MGREEGGGRGEEGGEKHGMTKGGKVKRQNHPKLFYKTPLITSHPDAEKWVPTRELVLTLGSSWPSPSFSSSSSSCSIPAPEKYRKFTCRSLTLFLHLLLSLQCCYCFDQELLPPSLPFLLFLLPSSPSSSSSSTLYTSKSQEESGESSLSWYFP